MKALQVVEPGEIIVADLPEPGEPGPGEVLVKTKAAGICYSDIHIYHGTSPFALYPRVIGHEAVGEVYKTGEGVAKVKPGDRVVLEPIEPCGHCYACRKGRPNVCESMNVRGVNKDGGFQEYFTAFEDKVHKFSDSLDWKDAVMIEPFTIGAQVCFRGGVEKDDLVLIIGAGPTGLAVLENAKLLGAKVIISDLSDKRLDFAKEFGADYTVNPEKADLAEEVQKISEGMMCNVVIDAAGTPATLEQAVTLASTAGRIVCLGFTDTYAKMSMLNITKKELTVVGSRLQTYQFEKCVKVFNEGKTKITKLITHVFDYDKVQEAFDLIENNQKEIGKIILSFDLEEDK